MWVAVWPGVCRASSVMSPIGMRSSVCDRMSRVTNRLPCRDHVDRPGHPAQLRAARHVIVVDMGLEHVGHRGDLLAEARRGRDRCRAAGRRRPRPRRRSPRSFDRRARVSRWSRSRAAPPNDPTCTSESARVDPFSARSASVGQPPCASSPASTRSSSRSRPRESTVTCPACSSSIHRPLPEVRSRSPACSA